VSAGEAAATAANEPLSRHARAHAPEMRADLKIIADMVDRGARVLDIGCGDGALLDYLVHAKAVDGRGIEISQAGVNACVAQGLSVIQGDADTDLKDYPPATFDYAILSQTLQATRHPRAVLRDLCRIGRRAIVSFPNFGYWKVRWCLGIDGRMPVTTSLPESWYATPNIHLCTIRDFTDLCHMEGIVLEKALVMDGSHRARPIGSIRLANLFGEQGMFLLRRE